MTLGIVGYGNIGAGWRSGRSRTAYECWHSAAA